MAERKNEAIWSEGTSRWHIKVQKDGVRKSFYSTKPGKKGKIEAEKKADAWLDNGFEGGVLRFGAVWQQWLETQRSVNGELNPTYQKNLSIGKNHVLPLLEHKRLSSMKPSDYQSVIDTAFSAHRLARKTLNNIRGSLTSFYDYCRKHRYQLARPEDIVIPRAAVVGERTILQPDDLKKLMSIDSVLRYGKQSPCFYIHFWRFAVLTGLRPGEIVGLQREDIQNNVLTVRRAINVDRQETQGKNFNARRSILLTQYAMDELQAQYTMLQRVGIISPWVFPARDGDPASERAVYKAWCVYRAEHGLVAASLYELRHTFVSVNSDMPEALLKQIVGHSVSMDTRGVYGHIVDGQKQRAAQFAEAAFDNVLKL